ncbi:MAG: hypothetical protein AAF628_36885, partial [Planctomycetota bacterium]
AAARSAALRRRQVAAALPLDPRPFAGWQAVPCRVVARAGTGGAGRVAVLTLDRRCADVVGHVGFATYGYAIVGFADPRAAGPEPVEVALLHAREAERPRRFAAEVDVEGRRLRFVIEPSANLDQWPLRCTTIDDPYAASQLRYSGAAVRTAALADDPLGALPPGLRVGSLRVWGYPGERRHTPIGLFVEPDFSPEAISMVVLWRPAAAAPPPVALRDPLAGGRLEPARVLAVPAPPPVGVRWLVHPAPGVPARAGAALVAEGRLHGTLTSGGRGWGLATPFGRSHRRWSLTLLPDDPSEPPRDLVARSVAVDGVAAAAVAGGTTGAAAPQPLARVLLEVIDGPGVLLPGALFSGGNGVDCPPGLWVGRVEPRGRGLAVVVPATPAAGLSLFAAEGAT